MKYVRTKNGIVDISNYIEKDFYYQDTKTPDYIGKEKIIKQSDSIEELCDEFVMYWLPLEEMSINESWIPYAQYERLGIWQKMRDTIIKEVIKTKSVLYGAIWTEKGLIYIAKMNKNGELELI